MKKDIEWLKSAIQMNLDFYNDNDEEWQMAKVRAYGKALELINQLDEPEVLSQEWLDKNKSSWTKLKIDGYYIPVEKLQNLLVPKKELPVIPKFVADWIEEAKGRHHSLYEAMADYCSSEMNQWIQDFYHSDLFARAWLDGYTVEEEQKYLVNILDEGTGAYLIYYPKSGNYGVTGILDDSKGITRFTEQEIKDYDERFWPFAVKVEELEE